MIISGLNFVFLFGQGREQLHLSDMNTRVAIPFRSNEVRYQIMLDSIVAAVFFVRGGG
jgi:hypothetical protein